MKIIPIYILSAFFFLASTLAVTHAAIDDKGEGSSGVSHTQHPPHDHHETDHIKKLDENMRRKREDEEKSH